MLKAVVSRSIYRDVTADPELCLEWFKLDDRILLGFNGQNM